MKKKCFLIVLLAIGTFPFLIPLIAGIYKAAIGFSGLAVLSPAVYGWEAFMNFLILYSYLYWPTYLIGALLICIATVLLKRKR